MTQVSTELLNLELQDNAGNSVKLSDYAGKYLVLYFYPKDDTPGCTKEACSFRDVNSEIRDLGAAVIGVSKDNPASHQKFASKYQLNFPLLSDQEAKLIKGFDVWQPKKFMGREFMGIVRTTFIIGPDGTIIKRFDKVNPKNHAAEVKSELKKHLGNQ